MNSDEYRTMIDLWSENGREARAYARFRCNQIALGIKHPHAHLLHEIAEANGDAQDLDPMELN